MAVGGALSDPPVKTRAVESEGDTGARTRIWGPGGLVDAAAAPELAGLRGPARTHRTFSCQGSLRATAEGSSGSRLKAVGV